MIIGNGQIASSCQNLDSENVLFFASGVSNSNCTDPKEYALEKDLLNRSLKEYNNKTFVYFSSCILSSKTSSLNIYYNHKLEMENLIERKSHKYYIFRIPQVLGRLQKHTTLINHLWYSIVNEKPFKIHKNAYRYVIDISDLNKIIKCIMDTQSPNLLIDLGNPFPYKVLDIVNMLEKTIERKATYTIIDKGDKSIVSFEKMLMQLETLSPELTVPFGKDYLYEHLKLKLDKQN